LAIPKVEPDRLKARVQGGDEQVAAISADTVA
jgi:hypothetical protein